MRKYSCFIYIILFLISINIAGAAVYSYNGSVSSNVSRDRIIAIGEDYATIYYYLSSDNAAAQCVGTTPPDTTVGYKNGVKYCWGGEVSTTQYTTGLAVPYTAGNKNTSSSSGYDTCAVGADCSGFVSNAWTSSRRSTSSFPGISDDITWEQLKMGDAMNYASSHIRMFDYFVSDVNTIMQYESTSGGGLLWKNVHRTLTRPDDFSGYQPIRYNSTYDVYNYAQPDITYIKRTGIERVELRWDGEGDLGFRVYISTDASTWTMIRDYSTLTLADRTTEISGLIPDKTYYFKVTAVNAGPAETVSSDITSYRLDGALQHRVLLVDGFDRYQRLTNPGVSHNFVIYYSKALGKLGVGFDFTANEGVVDEQIDLDDYTCVIWMIGNDSTFDETFSWPEQMHIMDFLSKGGTIFVSGPEIGWDLDYSADSTTYKNGSSNDKTFYNTYLKAAYSADDANTYHVLGASGTIFNGMDFYFDDGTHGTYNVSTPDVITANGGSTAGLNFTGGTAGAAGVYGSTGTNGKVVNLAFPFETIYPETARDGVMKAVVGYFDPAPQAPVIKSVVQSANWTATITWEGYTDKGFKLFQKTGTGAWTEIKNESMLTTDIRSTTVSGLTNGTRYEFMMQAVHTAAASEDSDVMIFSPGSSTPKILVVDAYDRWNAQKSGANHTLLESFADALTTNGRRYDSCANEAITEGSVILSNYQIVMWMCGQEAAESETFSYDEQTAVQNFLKQGGKLFVSGSEIGWDLSARADTANEYNNGNTNDTPFLNNYLKAAYSADDAAVYTAAGKAGTVFEGRSITFDNGTHGTYDVAYPDVFTATGGSITGLTYGSGSTTAGLLYTGTVSGGTAEARIITFGFPFETIYPESGRADIMQDILEYFEAGSSEIKDWQRIK